MENILGIIVGCLFLVAILVGLVITVRKSLYGPSEEEYFNELQRDLDNQASISIQRYIWTVIGIMMASTTVFFVISISPFLNDPQWIATEGVKYLETSCYLSILPGVILGFPLAYHMNMFINRKLVEKKLIFEERLAQRKKESLKLVKNAI